METCPANGDTSNTSVIQSGTLKTHYVLVILGSSRVGKTAIVQQFLYDTFPDVYKATVEEFHRSEYKLKDFVLTLDILDTSGSYEFPAMKRLAINMGDAFVLVYSIDDAQSFEDVCREREYVQQARSLDVPIVVVGNKCDREDHREVGKELTESVVTMDWENGFVEASAKTKMNIFEIFNELLAQARAPSELSVCLERRRQSLPIFSVAPKVKYDLDLKRHSCVIS
ncbi:dexamethasone-induced Ras-related protein 1-like [Limulus polyphemus]|uniref:Dexamethasone-induced Ras-related protein 1-like n=1 Tax=Limulus polyphemus TaxID=6850 RepID=A0ABM1BJY3_LIMPO|nr:dexamethasone-induced Ras-related protein 1-like [Limulus polyphemus]